jgi:hypothetical protein
MQSDGVKAVFMLKEVAYAMPSRAYLLEMPLNMLIRLHSGRYLC